MRSCKGRAGPAMLQAGVATGLAWQSAFPLTIPLGVSEALEKDLSHYHFI